MNELGGLEKTLLQLLDGHGGYETGYLAQVLAKPAELSTHKHSANVRRVLLVLENKGLVKRLDDEKPVCWVKT